MSTPPVPDLSVEAAISGRRSIRRFLDTPVPAATVAAILEAAARSASGVNMQPWGVHVVTGETRTRLSLAARTAARAEAPELEYAYLPSNIPEPYLSRRRKLGYDLYALYGVDRADRAGRLEAMLRNYDFFGAPVGLFFILDRVMTQGAWLDCGMFMQNVMLLARSHGLETCPQQAWCDVGGVVHRELGIPDTHILLSGMALGFADPVAPENQLVTARESTAAFATWHG